MNLGSRIRFLPHGLALTVLLPTLTASASDAAVRKTSTRPPSTDIAVPGPLNFGLDDYEVAAVGAYDFEPFRAAGRVTGVNDDENGFSWATGGSSPIFVASVPIPAGAVIDFVGLQYCDSAGTSEFNATVFDIRADGSFIPFISTTFPDAPCGIAYNAVAAGYAWTSNATRHVDIYLFQTGPDVGGEVKFRGAEIWYKRTVSPAPGVNTFSDVLPGDSAFQFIEAFVAAGITVGCDVGPPARYCPDDTVTRRQMAVFFAKALGLHFPE